MRIACCHCGTRGNEEFTYLGDATLRRPGQSFEPTPAAATTLPVCSASPSPPSPPGEVGKSTPQATDAEVLKWHDYVYLRANPAGPHRELWQHTGGCRAWLVVTRDTKSHEITAIEPARDVALSRVDAAHG